MLFEEKEDFFCENSFEYSLFEESTSRQADLFDLNNFGNTCSLTDTERNFSAQILKQNVCAKDLSTNSIKSDKPAEHPQEVCPLNISYKTDELLRILAKEIDLKPQHMYLDNNSGQIVLLNRDLEVSNGKVILQPEIPTERTAVDSYSLETLNEYSFSQRTRFSKRHDRGKFLVYIYPNLCEKFFLSEWRLC